MLVPKDTPVFYFLEPMAMTSFQRKCFMDVIKDLERRSSWIVQICFNTSLTNVLIRQSLEQWGQQSRDVTATRSCKKQSSEPPQEPLESLPSPYPQILDLQSPRFLSSLSCQVCSCLVSFSKKQTQPPTQRTKPGDLEKVQLFSIVGSETHPAGTGFAQRQFSYWSTWAMHSRQGLHRHPLGNEAHDFAVSPQHEAE